MSKIVQPVALLIFLFALAAFTAKPKLSLEGTWKISEVQTVKADGSVTSVIPRESEVIFTKDHYSFAWTSHNPTTHSWQMTDSMKLSRFSQMIVNTGTYRLNDSLLTTEALFSLNPMFTGGSAQFQCSFSRDTLILTGLNVFSSDKVPNPVYAAGAHIVNRLVRMK